MKTTDSVMREFDEKFVNYPPSGAEWKIPDTNGCVDQVKAFLSHSLAEARREVNENTSDGYHTFKELYEFRKLYNAALFNEWSQAGKYNIHKSKRHFDGEDCFGGGWFIVMATLPTGQISNHYELKDWDLFKCEIREKADEWDGHTAQDVAKRLSDLLTGDNPEREGIYENNR